MREPVHLARWKERAGPVLQQQPRHGLWQQQHQHQSPVVTNLVGFLSPISLRARQTNPPLGTSLAHLVVALNRQIECRQPPAVEQVRPSTVLQQHTGHLQRRQYIRPPMSGDGQTRFLQGPRHAFPIEPTDPHLRVSLTDCQHQRSVAPLLLVLLTGPRVDEQPARPPQLPLRSRHLGFRARGLALPPSSIAGRWFAGRGRLFLAVLPVALL